VRVKQGDTIILSSSIIPGNERGVQVLKDDFTRQGARVYQSKHIDIHSSGHAPQEELKQVLQLIKPKFFVPVHGYYFMRAKNKELAVEVGMHPQNVFLMDNGEVAEISKTEFKMSGKSVDASYVFVDGLGVGDVGEVVLRDRMMLAQEGMIVIIATLNKENWQMLKNPDIISRGFIYLKENQEILDEIRKRIRSIISRFPRRREVESDYLKTLIRDQIGQFLYNKTRRRPMILPVLIEV
jgi:ribonuclease J